MLMWLKNSLLFFLGVLLVGCGPNQNPRQLLSNDKSSKIVGGRSLDTTSSLSKNVALLRSFHTGSYTACTVVILAKNIVLTAAHCFEGPTPQKTTVFFGTDESQKAPEIAVTNVVIHPKYQRATDGKYYDLAVLKLRSDIPSGYMPLSIYTGTLSTGSLLTVMGYGLTSYTQPDLSAPFKLKDVNLVLRAFDVNSNAIYLSANTQAGINVGDSGGPVLVKANDNKIYVAGVAKGFEGSGPTVNSAIYTMLKTQQNWIQETITDLNGGQK